jgi:hypothetical protein
MTTALTMLNQPVNSLYLQKKIKHLSSVILSSACWINIVQLVKNYQVLLHITVTLIQELKSAIFFLRNPSDSLSPTYLAYPLDNYR